MSSSVASINQVPIHQAPRPGRRVGGRAAPGLTAPRTHQNSAANLINAGRTGRSHTFVLVLFLAPLLSLVNGTAIFLSKLKGEFPTEQTHDFCMDSVLGAECLRREKYLPARARCVGCDEAETD